jgi:SAM-dependent methyltransferase
MGRREVGRHPVAEFLRRIYEMTDRSNEARIVSLAAPRRGGRMIDLGCGDGELTKRVARAASVVEVEGVEYIPHVAEIARGRGVRVAEVDLADPLPFATGEYDIVLCNQVIEHVRATDHLLREIRRLLSPSGYAIVSTNNLASWSNVASLVLGWQPPPCHVSDEIVLGSPASFAEGDPGFPGQNHLRLFTGRALIELAQYHGLGIDRELSVGYYPAPPWLAGVLVGLDRRHGAFLTHRYTKGGPASAPGRGPAG